ncbi:MAG: hypothetical protein SOH93_01910 [Oscillospiraceae bacterium]
MAGICFRILHTNLTARRATWFCIFAKGIDLHPNSDGGPQERGKRAGTENVAAIVAMASSLKKNCERMEEPALKLHRIEERFLENLTAANFDYIRNGNSAHLPKSINISIRGADGDV